ncbi:proteinase-activated receptor 4 [Oncorhynchus tshawytscha]|uniref:Proteinase-activated receptor 4 n=1 Tax=Oncorhynchus tshawytscha TaxID=74940 RepID=A0A8C8JPI4_ONCTS|nr:proteinase-activated receptor 4 [Oncorhynchus tshawytscha]
MSLFAPAGTPAGTLLLLLSLSALLHGCSSSSTTEECTGMGVRLRSFKLVSNCNFTTLKDKQIQEVQAPTTVLYVPMLYLVAFTVGLPANLLALWVLLFRTKKMPSTILLINLTATDLMILMVLPFRIVYHFQGNDWVFGEPFCRVVTALFYGNMYGSVLCLAFIAVDRYVALVHPFGAKTLRSFRTSLYMSLGVWVVALAAMVPLLVSRQSYKLDEPSITTCHDALPEEEHENYFLPYFLTLFFLCFLLPLLVVLYCYGSVIRTLLAGGQRYAHAVRVTVLVLVVFVGCLLPSNVLLLLHYSDSYLVDDGEDLYVPYMVSLAVSTLNSCIDPFIFYYVSDDFREKVRTVLCCRGDNGRDSTTGNQVSYSSTSKGTQRSKVTLLSNSTRSPVTSEGEVACR